MNNKKQTVIIVLFIFIVFSSIFYTILTVFGSEELAKSSGANVIKENNTVNKTTIDNETEDNKNNNKVTTNESNTNKNDNKIVADTKKDDKKNNQTNKTNQNNQTSNTKPVVGENTSAADNSSSEGNASSNELVNKPVKPDNKPNEENNAGQSKPNEEEKPEPVKNVISTFVENPSSVYYVDGISITQSGTDVYATGTYESTEKSFILPLMVIAPESFPDDILQNASLTATGGQPLGYANIQKDNAGKAYFIFGVRHIPGQTKVITVNWGDGTVISYTVHFNVNIVSPSDTNIENGN